MTLAANVILQGLILVQTGGSPTPAAPDVIKFLSVGRLGPVPVIVLIWAALTVAASLLLSKAAFGRHLYALGTSATVADLLRRADRAHHRADLRALRRRRRRSPACC